MRQCEEIISKRQFCQVLVVCSTARAVVGRTAVRVWVVLTSAGGGGCP